ncbi:DUF4232 domain-containing protein [Streptacidiphilus cavernicola]|uniref:DUF4232 domain-containing protein n=1 Tax=Streptacidiphilus cavernicola TaxID=3342716 RepID=A0ABV6VNA5_9ACTN
MSVQLRGLGNLRMAATVGMVLAAGAALTACQGGASGSAVVGGATVSASAAASAGAGDAGAGGAGSTAAPAPAPTTAAASGSSGGGNGGTGGGSGAGSGAAAGAAGAAATTTRCRTANLGFSFGPDSGAQAVGSQGGIDVVLTNKGGGDCTLYGFPGVDIVSKSGTHWSLARQAASVRTVTLKPGAKASFEITYMPFDSGSPGGSVAFKAADILVTPPGETHSATLKWDGFADVMDQSGATHPGTYVGPVTAGD